MLLLPACDGRPKGVLSQSKMTDILVDMHKTDALLFEKGYMYGRYENKAPYYKYIFKKYDISKEQFDSSLVWYTQNPQRFENVYDNVTRKMEAFQKDVDQNKYHPIDYEELGKLRQDLWTKSRKFNFTNDSVRTKVDFEIINENLLYRDVYKLKFLIRIAKEDSCLNRIIQFKINYFNGKSDIKTLKSYNDGITRRYTVSLKAFRPLKIKSVSGQLLGCSACKGVFHSTIDSISFVRECKPAQMDSLRRIVQDNDPTEYKGALKFNFHVENKPASFRKSRIIRPN